MCRLKLRNMPTPGLLLAKLVFSCTIRYSLNSMMRFVVTVKTLVCFVMLLSLSGCGAISATTLRCGTDGATSYVEVASAPQSLSQNTRALAELCAFAYEGNPNESS